jgi:hypothetical protein
MHRRPIYLPKYYFSTSDTNLCYRLIIAQGLLRPEALGKFINIIHLFGSRTRDSPAWIISALVRYRVPLPNYGELNKSDVGRIFK